MSGAGELAEALSDVMGLIERGWLVRNTANDMHLPSYIAESTALVNALAKANAALRAPGGEGAP